MVLHLLPQYKTYIVRDNNYTFITDSGVIYTAYFIPCSQELNIYSFSFEKTNSTAYVPDARIKNTIMCLVSDFINKNNGAILYTCDSLDGKEVCRSKLFYRWFEEYCGNALIIKSLEFKGEDYNFLSSIIFKSDTILKLEIIDYFDEQARLYI